MLVEYLDRAGLGRPETDEQAGRGQQRAASRNNGPTATQNHGAIP